jgi:hypothetical protein
MTVRERSIPMTRALALALVLTAVAAPAAARAKLQLLDHPLRAPGAPVSFAVFPEGVLAQASPRPETSGGAGAPSSADGPSSAETPPDAEAPPNAETPPAEETPPTSDEERGEPSPEAPTTAPSLDFDLLGVAKPPPETADAGDLRLRRDMLTVHQGIGLGLLGLQLATTVVGQLNYLDQFADGPQTMQYRLTHKTLAYSTLSVFAVNGLIALLAPSPKTPRKFDRVMVHRIAMFTAAAGMVTQAILGIYTRERVGYLDQERFATVHLVVGYVTLAAMLTGVGALVF